MSGCDPRPFSAYKFESTRIDLGFNTRSAIADEIGVCEQTIKSWELGKRPVPKYAWRALARIQKMRG